MLEQNHKTNVVITMAGLGSRFYKAGYTQPKYAIEAHGRTLFEWSMLSLKNIINAESRLIFVCLQEHNATAFVKERCLALGYSDVHIVEIQALTDGQATSALLSHHLWVPNTPLLIYNIDTYVQPSALTLSDMKQGSQGWVPCFQVPGDHWSFVRLGEDGWAIDCAEKTRISNYASIGLYWFASGEIYADAYQKFFSDPANLVNGERYIAPLYKQLLEDGKKVSIADLPVTSVHVIGTPAELDVFKSKPLDQIGL